MILFVYHFYRLKNSASSLSLSGWRHISRTGSNNMETCTAPAVPRGGSLVAGSGFTFLFLLAAGTGILMGAGGAPVANAWFMVLFVLIVNIRALAAR